MSNRKTVRYYGVKYFKSDFLREWLESQAKSGNELITRNEFQTLNRQEESAPASILQHVFGMRVPVRYESDKMGPDGHVCIDYNTWLEPHTWVQCQKAVSYWY